MLESKTEEGANQSEPKSEHVDEILPESNAVSGSHFSWQVAGVFFSVSLGFYAGLLGSLPSWNVLSRTIPQHLGQSTSFDWAFPTLLFCQSISAVLFGRISDFVGRRWIFVGGNGVAFIGFLTCGRVSEPSTIVGMSAVIGVGTGIQLMGPFLALAELVPIRHRFSVVGASMSLIAPVLAMCPAIVQALEENTGESWRSAYSITASFSFVATLILFILYHPSSHEEIKQQRADNYLGIRGWIGIFTLATSTSIFTYALLWGSNNIYAWDSAQIIAVLVISGLFLVIYVAYELILGGDLRVTHGRHWFQTLPTLIYVQLGTASTLLLWFFPSPMDLVYDIMMGESGMKAAWDKSAFFSGLAGGFILATISLARPKHVKWHMAGSITVAMVFLSSLAVIDSSKRTEMLAFSLLIGLGLGYSMVVSHVVAPLTTGHQDMGIIVGGLVAFRNLSYGILSSVYLAIFTPRFNSKLQDYVTDAASRLGVPQAMLPVLFETIQEVMKTGDPAGLMDAPGIPPPVVMEIQKAVMDAAANAFRFVLLISNVYTIPMIMISMLAWNAEKVLSLDRWARLHSPGRISRLFQRSNSGVGY